MCGPSASEEQLAGQSSDLSGELAKHYSTAFADQRGVLDSISKSLSPILAAGPSQRGFSASENAALQSQALNSAGAASRNAQQAAATFGAGQGTSSGLLSGVTRQIQGALAGQSANQLAGAQNNIAQADFAQGNQNYWRAAGGAQSLANSYDPNGAAGAAIKGNEGAFGEASQITKENNQEAETIAGGLTSLAGSAGTFVEKGGLTQLQNFFNG